MAGGEHRTRQTQVARSKVEAVGARQADPDDVAALGAHALGEGRDEIITRGAHVLPYDDSTRAPSLPAYAEHLDERRTDRACQCGVELLGDEPAHVVRLEDRVQSRGVWEGLVAG